MSSEEEPRTELSPDTIRTTKPGLKRLSLTVTVLVSFIIVLPLLYKSVRIHRSPLPFHLISSLSSATLPPSPLHFHIITSLSLDFTSLPLPPNSTLHLSSNPSLASLDLTHDEDVDEQLRSLLGGRREYCVVVVERDDVEGVRGVVGKYRQGWIVAARGKEREVEEMVGEIVGKVFVNGGREEGAVNGEFMPVGADGRIVLSFNLLNSDPRDHVFDWNFQEIDETLMSPVIEVLEPIANISVESQVLYHTPKSSFSSWDEKLGAYVFRTKDLPFFVNSNEWHLDTSIAAGGRSKILQFVVYVPSSNECPLLLQLPNGEISATNSFISPMWGGVMVWNPPSCLTNTETKLPTMHMISSQDMQKIFEVFLGQLRQLFGLKSDRIYVGSAGAYKLLASERGFTQWELDFLARQHTSFNLHSSATTLESLSRLVQSLPRMIIMDEIGKQVGLSLEEAKLAQTNASLGVYDASAVSSRQARSLAEDAFFHPSIMSVSYYSFEHCFAVYSPFFLPVSMHVIIAVVREWKRYRHENGKYLRWKATQNPAS